MTASEIGYAPRGADLVTRWRPGGHRTEAAINPIYDMK